MKDSQGKSFGEGDILVSKTAKAALILCTSIGGIIEETYIGSFIWVNSLLMIDDIYEKKLIWLKAD